MPTVPFIDITDPQFRFDSPALAAAREEHWYADTAMGPLILRYQQAVGLLADRRLSPTGSGHLAVHGITDGPIHDYFSINMSSRAKADHARLRASLAPYLTSKRLQTARTSAASIIQHLADQLADTPADFLTSFADPLTISVFCDLIGIPAEDYDRYGPWSRDVGLIFGLSLDGLRDRVEDSLRHLFAYFADLLDRRRTHPGTDFVSALATADHTISQPHCLSALVSLIMGGHDAPMHQLAYAIATFAEHPDQWDILAAHPELADQATEEVLRWSSHTHTMRFALQNVAYHDLRLSTGELAITANLTANRDPRAFPSPGQFDITAPRPNPPIAFGGGPYYCPGHGLARMEIAEALTQLTRRFHPPRVTGPIRWRPLNTTAYGPETLPVRFTSR